MTFLQVFLWPAVRNVNAQLDPNDVVSITTPLPNSTVTGAIELRYRVYDNNMSSIPTRIEVLEETCEVKVRTILNSNLPSTQSQQVRGWNTGGAYADGGELTDGDYCLSICADLKRGQTDYTLCRRQEITLRNRPNNSPRITSTPSTTIDQGDDYSYDINFSDIDGDDLNLRIVQKPSFLQLNGTTLIGSNIQQPGQFKIVIEVTDNFGGLARQTYTLTVDPLQQPDPQPDPGDDPGDPIDPEPDPSEPQQIVDVNFIYPINDSVLSGDDNLIEWDFENLDREKVQKFELDYSLEGEEDWEELLVLRRDDFEDGEITDYSWDVSDIENGDYELRITLQQRDSDTAVVVSPIFSIENQSDDDDDAPDIVEDITISQINPENGAAIEELADSKLSAVITISEDADIDSLDLEEIEVSINGESIANDQCEFSEVTNRSYRLVCDVDVTVPDRYSVEINIPEYDTSRSWEFSIVEESGEEEPADLQDILPLLLIVAVVLCIVLLPLLLLAIVRRRRARYEETTTDITTETTTDTDPLASQEIAYTDPFDNDSTINTNYITTADTAEAETDTLATNKTVETSSANLSTSEQEKEDEDGGSVNEKEDKKGLGAGGAAAIGAAFAGVGSKVKNLFSKEEKNEDTSQDQQDSQTDEQEVTSDAEVDATPAPAPEPEPAPLQPSEQTKQKQSSSTAEFLEDEFDITDNYPDDNPVAPVATSTAKSEKTQSTEDILDSNAAPTTSTADAAAATDPKPDTPPAPVPQNTPAPPQPKPEPVKQEAKTTESGEDDLPDWLKAEEDAAQPAGAVDEDLDKNKKQIGEQEDDDGSDPYGFGEYSIGEPN